MIIILAFESRAVCQVDSQTGRLTLFLQVYAMSDWRRGYHFSAANDVRAWSADGSRLLSLRSSQLPHDVEPGDSVEIGYIPFNTGASCGVTK